MGSHTVTSSREKLSWQGEEIFLYNVESKVVRWVHEFKSIGDVLRTCGPAHGALAWVAPRFLLPIWFAEDLMDILVCWHLAKGLRSTAPHHPMNKKSLKASSTTTKEESLRAGVYNWGVAEKYRVLEIRSVSLSSCNLRYLRHALNQPIPRFRLQKVPFSPNSLLHFLISTP
jgi:hypothetical protein